MSPKNFKDFLTFGLCLQTGQNSFKVLVGPFTLVPVQEIQASNSASFLYKTDFWDFLKSDSPSAQNLVYKPAESYEMNREEIIRLLESQPSETPVFHWEKPSENAFKEQFDWSQNLFKKGILKKTVPIISQSSRTKVTNETKVSMLLHLLKQNSFGWTYAYFENESGIIGHTPELLLEWKSGQLAKTVALAGTVPNVPGAKTEIANDLKIRQEHDFVIDDLQLKLSGFSAKKETTEVLELKHLLHLQTEFKVSIENSGDVLKCIALLHPTAAMGIYPYNTALLKEFSEFDLQSKRGAFAGPVGILNSAGALVVVPIRGLMFDSTGSALYSGCGVTAESRYESELQEAENKRNSVKKMLGLNHD